MNTLMMEFSKKEYSREGILQEGVPVKLRLLARHGTHRIKPRKEYSKEGMLKGRNTLRKEFTEEGILKRREWSTEGIL